MSEREYKRPPQLSKEEREKRRDPTSLAERLAVSEEKYPRVVEHKRPGCVSWYEVDWSPDVDSSDMPDRLTAVRCALAEEMEALLRRWNSALTSHEEMMVQKDTDVLLKRLEDAR